MDDARGSALLGLEKGFKDTEKALGDGRNWVLGGADVSLADVNG